MRPARDPSVHIAGHWKFSEAIAAINAKRNNKTEEDSREVSRIQFAGVYCNEEIGPYLPGPNIIRSLRNAANLAKKNRGGKDIDSARRG